MKFSHPLFLLPVFVTLSCSPNADEEQAAGAPISSDAEVSSERLKSTPSSSPEAAATQIASTPEDGLSHGTEAAVHDEASADSENEPSPLAAPADASIILPKLPPRPLPDIFRHLQEILMEQTEPAELLGVEPGTEMTDEERQEFEEARGHVHEALEAMQELFLAQMALVRVPLAHPDYNAMEADEIEECVTTCEEYLAESFRRDMEGFSYDESFLRKGCVTPGTRPGNQALLHLTELDSLIRAGEDILSPNEAWLRRLEQLMEGYLAYYEPNASFNGTEDRDPFCRMCTDENAVSWPNGTNPAAEPVSVNYRAAMRELIRREHRAWQRYFEAMSALVCPCSGYRGSGVSDFRVSCESYLVASRERFIYMLTAGADKVVLLSERACEKEAELRELHGQYSFGEIFTETAEIFRHPRLAGNPWCIRFPSVGAGFIYLKENEVLQQYLSAHPEGGEVDVRGYQILESRGEPYETVRPEDDYSAIKHPVPKPYGALELRQVFILQECPSREPAYQEY